MAEEARIGESNHEKGVGEESPVVAETRRGVFVLYQGCWLRPPAVQSVKILQEQFQARPDDVLLVTFPKCGTTWLKALAFTVTNRSRHTAASDGHPLLTRHPQDLVPYLEMPYRQLHPIAELEKLASPRLLSTHMPIALLSPCVCSNSSHGCRVVYLCRNPKDVFVSLWHFVNKVDADYTIDRAFELFSEGVSPYGPIWEHNLGFWNKSVSQSHSPPVLFLKYDEIRGDFTRYVMDDVSKVTLPDCPGQGMDAIAYLQDS